jgi:hypothetical protein
MQPAYIDKMDKPIITYIRLPRTNDEGKSSGPPLLVPS